MDGFEPVRIAARKLRAEISSPDEQIAAPELVERALRQCELEVADMEAANPVLAGALGLLDRQFGMVVCRAGMTPEARAEVIAHEIGHLIIHSGPETATREGQGHSNTGDPVQRVEAYGIKERREAQANVFARELLLPRSTARQLFFEGSRARAIASRLQLQLETVFQQLADSLLLPEPPPSVPEEIRAPKPMDTFQAAAANHRGVPFLLEAGPGTGKTKTLVGRIAGLLGEDVLPSSILALTFSNKAAVEMVDRIADAAGPKATEIWTGTFHSFGLDLIRKHHELFGRGQDPRLIDATEAIHLLEDSLPALPIVHHQNLFEPALALRDIFRAISRAKDELVDEAEYERLARSMAQAAQSDEDRIAAEKALEVALVYRLYQRRMGELGALDYGDLIMLPATRLLGDPQFAARLRERYRYVHVDEYQDVNRASAMLVKGIVGEGEDLWVVGDSRQSIYRFRGASAKNMARFEEDYPSGKRGRLGINYRSSQSNVDQFAGFGGRMRVSEYSLPLSLKAERGDPGTRPICVVATEPDEEMSALAGAIEELSASGLAHRDQVILARSNGSLAKVAEELEARGVPVLYLGPVFERPEVRDLVSLLSLLVDSSGTGLVRVGGLAEYAIPLADIGHFCREASDREEHALQILGRLETLSGLSPAGVSGLARLAAHLRGFDAGSTPWFVLMEYLFERSDYVRTMLAGQAPSDAMRRIAVRQLIDLVRSMPLSGSRSPIARALQRIRHMVMLSDDRELRQLPAEAAHLDGVQMMTMHGSKGLEFEAVHLPGLHAGGMPARNQTDRCQPPDGMITGFEEPDAHEAEEECLFFVAMSRARSHLRVYRSSTRGGRNANPSRFLGMTTLPAVPAATVPQIGRKIPQPPVEPLLEPSPPGTFKPSDLEQYDNCPRRFFYERVLGLRGHRSASAYLAAHRCLLEVLDYVRNLEPGAPYSHEAASQVYEKAWGIHGPRDHVFEQEYRRLTEGMLASFGAALSGSTGSAETWSIEIGASRVELRPDQILSLDGGKVVRTFRSGRPGTTEADRLANTLLIKAIGEKLGGEARIETLHLVTGTSTAVSQTPAKYGARLSKCEAAVAAVGRGEYPASPSEWSCPRCPFFFICPSPLPEQSGVRP